MGSAAEPVGSGHHQSLAFSAYYIGLYNFIYLIVSPIISHLQFRHVLVASFCSLGQFASIISMPGTTTSLRWTLPFPCREHFPVLSPSAVCSCSLYALWDFYRVSSFTGALFPASAFSAHADGVCCRQEAPPHIFSRTVCPELVHEYLLGLSRHPALMRKYSNCLLHY